MSRRSDKMVAAVGAVLAGMSGSLLAVTAGAGTASAATTGTFIQPAPSATPFAVPETVAGNPVPFTVSGTGFPDGPVYVEICDGVSPATPNYDVNAHCDAASANASVMSTGPASTVTFPANDLNYAVQPFRGMSPQDQFNCLAPEDVKAGSSPLGDGSVVAVGPTALNGAPIDTSNESWTNCQLRLGSSETMVTSDQVYQTIALPNSGPRSMPTVVVSPQVTPVPENTPTTITATVSGSGGTPTGTVTFHFNTLGTVAGCAAVTVGAAGVATCNTSGLPLGSDPITASYSGSTTYATEVSSPVTYVATQSLTPTATTLTSVPAANATPGASVTFTAAVAPTSGSGSPTGTVDFKSNGADILACTTQSVTAGKATCTTSALATGTDGIVAKYSGDGNFATSTSLTETFTVRILPAATVVPAALPASPQTYGIPVTVSATVSASGSPAPGGTVTFTVPGVTLPVTCTAATITAGVASCTIPALPGGTDVITATYSGDANYAAPATAPTVSYVVTPVAPTVAVSATPTTQGQGNPVALTAHVTSTAGSPTGTVSFQVGGQAVDPGCTGTTVSPTGAAMCTTSSLPVGTDHVTAVYSGNADFAMTTSPTPAVVTVAALLSTTTMVTAAPPSPVTAGTSVAFTATVSPATVGGVSFSIEGNTAIAGCQGLSPSSQGVAICTTASLPAGDHTVTATFTPAAAPSGSTLYAGSTGTVPYSVTAPPVTAGYQLVGRNGAVYNFGGAGKFGDLSGQHLNAPIVGLADTADQQGYRLVGSDGGVFTFGDAGFFGSEGNQHLNAPIVGMASTPDGKGYWLVGSDGGVFTFGDAGFFGSEGNQHINAPVVGITASPRGAGYLMASADGGVFTFGDAVFSGSLGGQHINRPVVGITLAPEGGYRLGSSDGGVFDFGGAGFFGSEGGQALPAPVSSLASSGLRGV